MCHFNFTDPAKKKAQNRKKTFFLFFGHSYGTPMQKQVTIVGDVLSREDAGPADLLDLLLGHLGKESRLDDDRLLGQVALAEDLEVSGAGDVDDGRLLLVVGVLGPGGDFMYKIK
jgi:hypothetical protein